MDSEISISPSIPDSEFEPKFLNRIFWIFVSLHALFWAFVPPFFMPYFRTDTVEMLVIGKQWILATDKHPAFPGWAVEILSQIMGNAPFVPYLAAQIAAVTAIWCVWKLGKEFLSPQLALVAALAMLAYVYFGYDSTNYNNRTFMRAFNALATYWTYRAFQTNRKRFWIGVGIALAGGIYSKFTMFLLALTIVSFMFVDSNVRKYWKTSGPYVTIGVCFLLFTPLLFELIQRGFAPFLHAKSSISYGEISHWKWGMRFALFQLPIILPVMVMLIPELGVCWKWNWRRVWGQETKDRFLTFMILFPYFLTILIAFVNGRRIRADLGCQIWIFLPVFLLYTAAKVRDDWTAIRCSLRLIGATMAFGAALSFVLIYFAPLFSGEASRRYYPAEELTREVERIWSEHFDTPFLWVRGDDWPCCAVVIKGNSANVFSPNWATEEEFRKSGGILLWQITDPSEEMRFHNYFSNNDFFYRENREPLTEWLDKFPQKKILEPIELAPNTRFPAKKFKTGIAIVPPEGTPLPEIDEKQNERQTD